MSLRRAALERVLKAGYRLFTVVHPRATIEPGAQIGAGCVVLSGAVIDQQVRVGPACFVDIGVRLTAGTTVGCNNYFSSGTATGSRVTIGDDCFFGMDCTITTEVQMGSNLFVNAKTLVPRNVGDNVKLVEVHKSRELPMPHRCASGLLAFDRLQPEASEIALCRHFEVSEAGQGNQDQNGKEE